MPVLKGFRDFVLRGNVLELAIGVVIGVAFNNLVTTFTKDFINPLVARAGGGKIGGTVSIGHGQALNWGDFISGVLNFAIVAAVLYFVIVLPMNKLAERRRRGEAPAAPAEPSDEVVLLTQIRDALVANAQVANAQVANADGANTPAAGAPAPRASSDIPDNTARRPR